MKRRNFLKKLLLCLPILFLSKTGLGKSKLSNLQFSQLQDIPLLKVKVIGVGRAGLNAVNLMIENRLTDIEFWVVDTENHNPNQIIIGTEYGECSTETKPNLLRLAVEEKTGRLSSILQNTKILFIVADMDEETDSGSAPVIAKNARNMGILTIAVISLPFEREQRNAKTTIGELARKADTTFLIPFEEESGDGKICDTIKIISNLMNTNCLINIDFTDIVFMLKDAGIGYVGFGTGKGDNCAIVAAKNALSSIALKKWKCSKMLVNIIGGSQMTLMDINAAMNVIYKAAGDNSDCNIVFGTRIDPQFQNQISLTILITGFDNNFQHPYLF